MTNPRHYHILEIVTLNCNFSFDSSNHLIYASAHNYSTGKNGVVEPLFCLLLLAISRV